MRSSALMTSPRAGGYTLILVVFGLLFAAGLFSIAFSSAGARLRKDKITSDALAQAKEALLAYAANRPLSVGGPPWPGDLPCPDRHNTGSAEPSCSTPDTMIGRVPWKTLKLPDLRDGDGERLWYAVSSNFRNNPRVALRNSDTAGALGVEVADGSLYASAAPRGLAIALVIAPGAVLTRQGAMAPQDRSCGADAACVPAGVCASVATPRCDPRNYLDNFGAADNALLHENPSGPGDAFRDGPVADASGTWVNDRILAIGRDDLMPLVEKRVAAEALACLTTYAAKPVNHGRYPWAAPTGDTTKAPGYADVTGTTFGRIPHQSMLQTKGYAGSSMDDSLTSCFGSTAGTDWWPNWREEVFYAVAPNYQPGTGNPLPCSAATPCLTVGPGSAPDKQVVVLVAGRRIGAQSRASPSPWQNNAPANFLELENASYGDGIYARAPASATFNDTVYSYPYP